MKIRTFLTTAVTIPFLAAICTTARAELPENYLKRWDDPAVQKRINDGIEKNRKSDAVLTIVDTAGKPVADAEVKVTQKSHEFLFGCNIFVLGQMKEKNAAYEEAFLKLFNFATIAFYWDDLEPESGKLRFTEGSPYIWAPAAAGPGCCFRQETRVDAQGTSPAVAQQGSQSRVDAQGPG